MGNLSFNLFVIVGWIGVILTSLSSVPQLLNTGRVSKLTYGMLSVGLFCLFVRALSINDPIFIASNAIGTLIALQIWDKLWDKRNARR